MKAINFPESNKILGRPPSMTKEECFDLHVFNDGEQSISCWVPDIWERIKLLFTGKIWIGVFFGSSAPPIWIAIKHPFPKRGKK